MLHTTAARPISQSQRSVYGRAPPGKKSKRLTERKLSPQSLARALDSNRSGASVVCTGVEFRGPTDPSAASSIAVEGGDDMGSGGKGGVGEDGVPTLWRAARRTKALDLRRIGLREGRKAAQEQRRSHSHHPAASRRLESR